MQGDLRKEFLVSGRVMFGDGWAGKNNVSSRVLRGDGTEFCIGLIGYKNEGSRGGHSGCGAWIGAHRSV